MKGERFFNYTEQGCGPLKGSRCDLSVSVLSFSNNMLIHADVLYVKVSLSCS